MRKGGHHQIDEVEPTARTKEEDNYRMMKQLEDIKILNSKMREASPAFKRDISPVKSEVTMNQVFPASFFFDDQLRTSKPLLDSLD